MAWYTGKTFRGVDYNPTWPTWTQGPGEDDVNLRKQTFDSDMFNDAFASLWAKEYQAPPAGHAPYSQPIQNPVYRDDLGTIAKDGFNLVRIYNWDVARGTPSGGDTNKGLDHANFLNYAKSLGLTVVVGLPDFMLTNGQFAWNHRMPDSTYSFGSAPQDIQNDFKQFIASITDPATGKIFTNVHISVGNEGDIGEGGIYIKDNPGASTNASEFLARINWWIHNLHQQINGEGPIGPDGLPVVNGASGAIVPITSTFAHGDAGNGGVNGAWMNWVVTGVQAGQGSPNGWQPNGQTFTSAVTGLAAVDPNYASFYYNSFNIGQAPQTAPYDNHITEWLIKYDAAQTPWPGSGVAGVPLMLMEVFNANRNSPGWGNPTNQALSAVNEAKSIEKYLALNKAGTPGSTTNLMGYNYFEFNDEPASGKFVGLYQYSDTFQNAQTGTSGIFYITRGGFENYTFPVHTLVPTPGPNGQGTLVGAWAATFPTFLNSHNDAFVVLQGSSLGEGPSFSVSAAAAPFGVLTNDVSEMPAAVALRSAAVHGELELGELGGVSYTARPGFSGIDGFSYFAFGEYGAADHSGVAIHVVPVNVGATSTSLNLLSVTPAELVAATYAAYFGRAADAKGYEFWLGHFNTLLPTQGAKAALTNVAHSFGTSDEAKALYPFLANPGGASDAQIAAFVDSVFGNLFARATDAAGSAYWVGQIKQAVQAGGQSVDLVLVNIMSGAQETAATKDITTMMSRVAVSMEYVYQQELYGTVWAGASDVAAATTLLHSVNADPESLLIGVRTAHELIVNHP